MRDRAAEGWLHQGGATIVEFALLLPLIMALLLGVFTGGHAYFRKITVTDAVREGARYGASLVDDASWVSGVKARVASSSGGELATSQVCAALVTVDTTTPDTTCGVDDPPGSDGQKVVKVSAAKAAKLEYFFGSRNLTLRGEAAALYERIAG